jgi:hypothetical protein
LRADIRNFLGAVARRQGATNQVLRSAIVVIGRLEKAPRDAPIAEGVRIHVERVLKQPAASESSELKAGVVVRAAKAHVGEASAWDEARGWAIDPLSVGRDGELWQAKYVGLVELSVDAIVEVVASEARGGPVP